MKTLVRGTTTSTVLFSDCGLFRYRFSREWDATLPSVVFCMLNPSIANLEKNDHTVGRCQKRAQLLGYGRLEVVNLFALVSTDPKALYTATDPVGKDNNRHIQEAVGSSNFLICAWGSHGSLNGRDQEVLQLLSDSRAKIHALKLNQDGSPCHPLYLGYDVRPLEFGMKQAG
jgi:hypothetical protein